jgi:hypothetical protein
VIEHGIYSSLRLTKTSIIAWLGRQSIFQTIDEDESVDIEEIRRLLDEGYEPESINE